MLGSHLPFYVSPTTCCWECDWQDCRPGASQEHAAHHYDGERLLFSDGKLVEWALLMAGLLHLFRESLGLGTSGELLTHLRSNSFHQLMEEVIPSGLLHCFDFFDNFMLSAPAQQTSSAVARTLSPPSTLSSLLHWRSLYELVRRLPTSDRDLTKFKKSITGNGYPPPSRQFFDSHCHMEQLLMQTGVSDLRSVLAAQPHSMGPNDCLLGVVSNFVFPDFWPTPTYLRRLMEDGRIYLTFGIHPRSSHVMGGGGVGFEGVGGLHLHSPPPVVGLGEIGLDFTAASKKQAVKQEESQRQMLPLALKYDLPVMVHARDSRAASNTCLEILKQVLPLHHLVHRHCFCGSLEEAEEWRAAFPNVVFGVAGTILNGMYHKDLPSFIQDLDLGQLVLETDSPYLLPPVFRGQTLQANRGMILEVAGMVAKWKHLPPTIVLRETALSAGIPR